MSFIGRSQYPQAEMAPMGQGYDLEANIARQLSEAERIVAELKEFQELLEEHPEIRRVLKLARSLGM